MDESELQRIAFARPVGDDGERLQAEAIERLRELREQAAREQQVRDDAARVALEPPPTPERSRYRGLVIAGAAAVVAALGVALAVWLWPAPDSLDVFDRGPTAEESARLEADPTLRQMSVAPETLRFLSMSDSVEAMGYLMAGDVMGIPENRVCLIVFEAATQMAMGGCSTVSEFRQDGLELVGASWGPTGGVRFNS